MVMPMRPSERSARRLRAVPEPPPVDPEQATREAWRRLADGCDRGLAVKGLPADEVAALASIRRSAAEVAGIAPCRPLGAA